MAERRGDKGVDSGANPGQGLSPRRKAIPAQIKG